MKKNLKFEIKIDNWLKCELCGDECKDRADFLSHIKEYHDYKPKDYLRDVILKGKEFKCQCGQDGCNTTVTYRQIADIIYVNKFTKNHFPRKPHTEEAKDKIRKGLKKTVQEKYGVDNIMEIQEYRDKIKTTKKEKYGDENYTNPIKNKQTKLERYGNENYQNWDKIRATNYERYGAPVYVATKEGQARKEQTCLEKYGFKHSVLAPEIIAKAKATKLAKYGYECEFTDPQWRKDHECNQTSTAELEVGDFIKSLGIQIERNHMIPNKFELDILIPGKNIAIEYNGTFWHGEHGELSKHYQSTKYKGKDKNYHINKTIECEKMGIRLIHIFSNEWLFKQQIIKNRLKTLLGCNENRIYARKCEIKILNKTPIQFLNENHLQGSINTQFNLALMYENNIVAAMTFSKRRVALGGKNSLNEYELVRYCGDVVGGASKLFNFFINKYKPSKIISYADKKWSIGNLYFKLGFNKVSDGVPNYWYTKDGRKIFHRFNFTKKTIVEKYNGDPNLTEWENMQILDYYRIWDCGSLKFEWTRN